MFWKRFKLLFGVKSVCVLEEIQAVVWGEISPNFRKDLGCCFGELVHIFKKLGLQRRYLEGLTNPELLQATISWNQDTILIQQWETPLGGFRPGFWKAEVVGLEIWRRCNQEERKGPHHHILCHQKDPHTVT